MKKSLIVGLTGGIGSGKSTVAKVFEVLKVPVFNADQEAKYIINNDAEAIEQVTKAFGSIYQAGKLDKAKLAALVFSNKEKLQQLNQIIHPKVALRFNNWIAANKTAPILIKEAAILIESGAYLDLDKIIVVTAPEAIRIKRVIGRDNVTEQDVKSRIQHQIPEEEKLKFADFTIVNDEHQLVVPQILKVYEQLLSN